MCRRISQLIRASVPKPMSSSLDASTIATDRVGRDTNKRLTKTLSALQQHHCRCVVSPMRHTATKYVKWCRASSSMSIAPEYLRRYVRSRRYQLDFLPKLTSGRSTRCTIAYGHQTSNHDEKRWIETLTNVAARLLCSCLMCR
jgi:hypothetical protein